MSFYAPAIEQQLFDHRYRCVFRIERLLAAMMMLERRGFTFKCMMSGILAKNSMEHVICYIDVHEDSADNDWELYTMRILQFHDIELMPLRLSRPAYDVFMKCMESNYEEIADSARGAAAIAAVRKQYAASIAIHVPFDVATIIAQYAVSLAYHTEDIMAAHRSQN